MRPSESFIGQPIRSLQTMLRVIAEDDPTYLPVIPDGIYGTETSRAVTTFQSNHGIPVTGIADQRTWETIVHVFDDARIRREEAAPIHIVLNPGQVIRKGERNPHIFLVQAMLETLSEMYESVSKPTHTGILDEATSDSIASFQYLAGLPATGHLDKITWKHLSLQYPLAAVLFTTLD